MQLRGESLLFVLSSSLYLLTLNSNLFSQTPLDSTVCFSRLGILYFINSRQRHYVVNKFQTNKSFNSHVC